MQLQEQILVYQIYVFTYIFSSLSNNQTLQCTVSSYIKRDTPSCSLLLLKAVLSSKSTEQQFLKHKLTSSYKAIIHTRNHITDLFPTSGASKKAEQNKDSSSHQQTPITNPVNYMLVKLSSIIFPL